MKLVVYEVKKKELKRCFGKKYNDKFNWSIIYSFFWKYERLVLKGLYYDIDYEDYEKIIWFVISIVKKDYIW